MGLGSINSSRAYEHRPADCGIADDGDVEFFTGVVDGITDPVPVKSGAIAEVHVWAGVVSGMETKFRVDRIKPGLPTVSKIS